MCDLKNNGNESIYKTETDSRLRKQIFGYHRGKGGGKEEIRSMRLTETNYYTQTREATRVYYIAQVITLNTLQYLYIMKYNLQKKNPKPESLCYTTETNTVV